ncbi:hypothetical protein [Streptomyces wuyuanensis]|uniref:Integral membrane protein n=1 Tax=Streptomyces wuyuanensis TaxID=1196353 RepID=A0A1G9UWK1_9ACTN|nr:hypothetical protein [Streptomyces wuyuanensis]SDM64303.1 hypothetical protein SAMN05444921_11173 [Streptomyces wuyuanensis]
MEARDHELTKELDATLRARHELGTEYESALVESFLEKVEQRMDAAVDRRVRRHLAERQMTAARGGTRPERSGENFGERHGLAIITLVLAVPLSAISVVHAGIEGLFVTWGGIVGVNAVHAFRGRSPFGRREKSAAGAGSDWED